MSKCKGIVSSGAVFHSHYIAQALEREEMLNKYIVGNHKKNDLNVRNKLITNIRYHNYIGFILRKAPIIGKYIRYNLISDNLFDFSAKKYLRDIDFFVGFNNFSLMQMKLLKKRSNVTLFLDQRIAHVNTELELSNKYYKRRPTNLGKIITKKKLEEYRLADYIFVGSRFVKDTFIQNGISEEKLILIPYGYDPNIFYCYDKSKKRDNKNLELEIVFVGQIGRRKGVNFLLESIKELKENGYKVNLTLAGNVDKDFESFFEKYNEYYTYKEYLNSDELRELYNNSDLMVFPSLWEGSARVLYDAAACGVVIVASKSSGSIIEDGKNGLILNDITKDSISKKIIKIYDNEKLFNRLRDNSLKVIEDYTWTKYGDKVTQAIKEKMELNYD